MNSSAPSILLKNVIKTYETRVSDSLSSLKSAWSNGSHLASAQIQIKKAVNNVNLTIENGQRVGIVGRNGAGKSTLLHLIAGLSTPSSGEIEINGKVTSVMTLGIGLRDDLSGRENIYIDGEIQGKPREEIDLKINEIIEFADIGEFIDYPVRTYSTGMKARLAFSMITSIDPEILIIDEALSVGDANFSLKATRKIMEICSKGKIVIIVSHGMGSIIDMCNRCIWMDNGNVIADGSPETVTKSYIDAVREEDEILLKKKFNSLMESSTSKNGFRVMSLKISYLGEARSRAIVESGTDIVIRSELQIDQPLIQPALKLTVTRIDGLVLLDNKLDGPTHDLMKTGKITFDIGLSYISLGKGIYEVSVSLTDENVIFAKRSTILEVTAFTVPRGGRPALLYPSKISLKAHMNERDN